MEAKNSFFTVVVRPIPRGIIKDDLVSQHLARFGQVKNVRFGDAKGAAGDVMFVDYFDMNSAMAAVRGLHGAKDPGTSALKMTAVLSKASVDASARVKLTEIRPVDNPDNSRTVSAVHVNASIKYLKPKGSGGGICILDLDSLADT